jgi:hypothetical protein
MRVREDLLRLSRHRCEERRRHLGELELLAARLRAEAGRLQAQLEEAGAAAVEFCGPLVERHAKVECSISEIEAQIGAARAEVAAAEHELQRRERDWISRSGGRPRPGDFGAVRRSRTPPLPSDTSSG